MMPFLEKLKRNNVIRFNGPYILKSGKKSNYFFDSGKICSNNLLYEIGNLFYEKIQQELKISPDILCGPAYKGISLVTATAMLFHKNGKYVDTLFTRKENKKYGEGKSDFESEFIGQVPIPPKNVVIIDDVITTAQTKIELIEKLKKYGYKTVGIFIVFDRKEKINNITAVENFKKETNIPVFSLFTVDDLA